MPSVDLRLTEREPKMPNREGRREVATRIRKNDLASVIDRVHVADLAGHKLFQQKPGLLVSEFVNLLPCIARAVELFHLHRPAFQTGSTEQALLP